jgi:phenylpropionate dioxygenase-like ring-hydroxylating dioxygenase large terminal subunit
MNLDFSFHGSSVNESMSLPKEFFTDPAIFNTEIESIFRKDWVPVARIDQLANPGDYITYDFFGDEIIVARDKSGNINAFSNICLHRACPIVEGSGSVKTLFTCPYHKWTYELNGKLRGAPDMEQSEKLDRDTARLPQLNVELWQGWVMVCAAENPEPLHLSVTELAERLAPWNMEDLKVAGVMTYDSPWNWKVLLENFMESYHHMGPHSETLNGIYPHSGTYAEETRGNYTLLENPSVDESLSPSFWVGLVFPTLMFAMSRHPGEPTVGWYQIIPKRFDQFELKIHVLTTQEKIDDGSAEGSIEIYKLVHSEDIPVCDGVWRGLHSSQYQPGPLSHLEGCIWRFHSYLRDKLQGA